MESTVAETRGVTVRPATTDDIDWLVVQLRHFSDYFGSEIPLFPDVNLAVQGVTNLIENHLVLIASNKPLEHLGGAFATRLGFIAGIVTPHLFNPDIRVLSETFWWVTPEHRGSRAGAALLDAFIAWGKDHADWITFALEARTPIKESALLKRGFRLQERSYLMEIV